MKKVLLIILIFISFVSGWLIKDLYTSKKQFSPPNLNLKTKPLDKYTIENLSLANIKPGKITMGMKLNETNQFTSYLFEFEFNPNLDGKTLKKITGQLNIPNGDGEYPLIIMLRGYINKETFKTGDGTRNASAFFAQNGFLTIAPDFLGYAGSDKEENNIFEARFQSYITILSLLKTIEQFPENSSLLLGPDQLTNQLINRSTVFLWGHSNGGQIALTTLEITGRNIPTTLWAPVSKPFPYSVLYYTDESEDRGKLIRYELAKFEQDYNSDLYSLDLYLDKISAPLQIHQGGSDEAVPKNWNDLLVQKLKDLDKDVLYHTYPGADHNMNPVWDRVVTSDLDFFKSRLSNH